MKRTFPHACAHAADAFRRPLVRFWRLQSFSRCRNSTRSAGSPAASVGSFAVVSEAHFSAGRLYRKASATPIATLPASPSTVLRAALSLGPLTSITRSAPHSAALQSDSVPRGSAPASVSHPRLLTSMREVGPNSPPNARPRHPCSLCAQLGESAVAGPAIHRICAGSSTDLCPIFNRIIRRTFGWPQGGLCRCKQMA